MGFIHSLQKYVILDSSIDANVDMDIDGVWEKSGGWECLAWRRGNLDHNLCLQVSERITGRSGVLLDWLKWWVKTNS